MFDRYIRTKTTRFREAKDRDEGKKAVVDWSEVRKGLSKYKGLLIKIPSGAWVAPTHRYRPLIHRTIRIGEWHFSHLITKRYGTTIVDIWPQLNYHAVAGWSDTVGWQKCGFQNGGCESTTAGFVFTLPGTLVWIIVGQGTNPIWRSVIPIIFQ